MKVLSLFDGISCARVALDRAGIPVEAYYASEIDKYAMQISAKNYPDILGLGDIEHIAGGFFINGKAYPFKKVDLLIGGSPCQDLSIAKKDRKGLAGDRSGLFWEYVRILNEVKPRYFVLENVASMPKEAKALITETLGVEPIMIDAALVSAQRRKRLFWVGKRVGDTYETVPVQLPEDRGILLKDILHDDGNRLSDREIDYMNRKKGRWEYGYIQRETEEKSKALVANLARGVPYNVFVMNVPSVVPKHFKNGCIRKLTPVECERLQSLPDGYTEGVSNTQRYKALGNAFNVEVVAHIFSFLK